MHIQKNEPRVWWSFTYQGDYRIAQRVKTQSPGWRLSYYLKKAMRFIWLENFLSYHLRSNLAIYALSALVIRDGGCKSMYSHICLKNTCTKHPTVLNSILT